MQFADAARDKHLSAVLQQLLHTPLARKELAAQTGISFTTITQLAQVLIGAGVIEEQPLVPEPGRRRGRPRTPLRIRQDGGKVVVGTQISERRISSGAYTLNGRLLRDASIERPAGEADAVLDATAELTGSILAELEPERLLGVGVCTGGVIDFEAGRVIDSPPLGWQDVDLRGQLTERLGVPVIVDESVRSLAVLRLWWEPSATDSLMVVFIGRVVGAALVLNRALYRGPGATAGTISHLPVAGGPGIRCSCGAIDCAGVVITNTALLHRAIAEGLLPADAEHRDVHIATGSAAAGLAELRRERARHVGETVAHLVEVVDPETMIIAGHLGTAEETTLCLETVRQRCRTTLDRTEPRLEQWPIRPSVWLAGAAAQVLDDFLGTPGHYLFKEP